jgi:16S rRNA (guanine(966)-N(2))-methyltransferase RsmD
MRVVAGEFRGMRLIGPKDEKIRPTMDRAKEGLFNVINQDIYDAKFLDLFAGTGSIGIEAISRGANYCIFIELLKINRR